MKAICKICYHYELCKEDERCLPEYLNCNFFKNKLDVVEVVHCRNCKHLYELSAIDRRFYCKHHPQGLTGINIIEDNPYCSYGERKCDND